MIIITSEQTRINTGKNIPPDIPIIKTPEYGIPSIENK
jgi:hypothetical protein